MTRSPSRANRRSGGSSHRRCTRGFTAIEVLIAMTIMAIGAAAVMTMQKASIQGNLDARKTDVANSIARMWVERLRRDSMQWTLVPGNGNANVINAASAQLLTQGFGQWFFPNAYFNATDPVPTMSFAFDILGRDLAQVNINGPSANPTFCVNVLLTSLTPTLMRADVRVLWPRGINTTPAGFCTTIDQGLAQGTTSTLYHAIYVTTALAVNASQPQ